MKPSHILVPLLISVLAAACSNQNQASTSPAAAAQPAVAATPTQKKCAWSLNVYFDKNSYEMNDAAVKVADQAAGLYRQETPAIMIVAGHTDATGTEEYNLFLSTKRALAVKKALVDRGLPATILAARANGQSDPAIPTTGDEPKDRRAVVTCRGPYQALNTP
jgi:outer membrane protein OmpA-like peptidoglycan-associated protein